MELTWQAYFTLGTLVLMVIALVRNFARVEFILLGTLGVLLLAQVVEPVQAFANFSNPAVIAIGALFVVAAAVERTGHLVFLPLHPLSGQPDGDGSWGINTQITRVSASPSALSSCSSQFRYALLSGFETKQQQDQNRMDIRLLTCVA